MLYICKICFPEVFQRGITYVVSTIETASFKTLSPKTSMYRTSSTFMAWNMASVATGSTADIREPKAKLSDNDSL